MTLPTLGCSYPSIEDIEKRVEEKLKVRRDCKTYQGRKEFVRRDAIQELVDEEAAAHALHNQDHAHGAGHAACVQANTCSSDVAGATSCGEHELVVDMRVKGLTHFWLPGVMELHKWTHVEKQHKPLPAYDKAYAHLEFWDHDAMWDPHVIKNLSSVADRMLARWPRWEALLDCQTYNPLGACPIIPGHSLAFSMLCKPLMRDMQVDVDLGDVASGSNDQGTQIVREYICMEHDGAGGDGFKCHNHGYLKVHIRGGEYEFIHRLICLCFHGPPGYDDNGKPMVVGHICNNQACWSPKHVRWVTQADNVNGNVPAWPV